MSEGWIHLHRSVLKHWVFTDPMALKAWLYILLTANHKDAKVFLDGELVSVKQGQFITSVRKFAEQINCTRRKAERLLVIFESDGMVTRERCKRGTLLTVVNYEVYQNTRDSESTTEGTSESTTEGTSESTTEGTSESTQTRMNKNNKNVKNEKKDIYTSAIAEIFGYLNLRTGKKYTGRSKAQTSHIIARLKEGYTVEEFKTVIDNKVNAWAHDDKMRQYLRPETLFSSKFETYLNDTETERQRSRREDYEIHEKQREAIRRAGTVEIGYNE